VDRTHPLANTLAELRRVSSYERVLLRGLTVDEVHRMLSGLSSLETPWQVAEVVHRQTEGNPLFVQEVLRFMIEDGLMVKESGEFRMVDPDRSLLSIPEGLRDVIGKRLSNLSSQCGQVLSLASVMGREFRFEVLQRVSDMPEEELFEALKEAIAAAVIEERILAGTSVIYRFTHAFMRQALYEEIIAPRRFRFHIQIAHVLEELFANRLAEHAGELFNHFSHSTNLEDLTKAVQYGEMAAERAISVFDYGEATRLLEQTLQVQDVLNPENKEKKCDTLLLLCESLTSEGFPRRVLDREAPTALALAEEIGDRKRVASICILAWLALARYAEGPALASAEMAYWVEKLDEYAEPDTVERALADCGLGVVAYNSGLFHKGTILLDKSLDLSNRLGDQQTYHYVASLWLFYAASPQYAEKRIALAKELHSRELKFFNLIGQLANVYLEHGYLEKLKEINTLINDWAEKTGQPGMIIRSIAVKSVQALLNGRLEEAVDLTQQIIDFAKDSEFAPAAQTSSNVSGLRPRLHLGKDEIIVNDKSADTTSNLRAKAWYLSLLGRKDEAYKILDTVIQT